LSIPHPREKRKTCPRFHLRMPTIQPP
jgi:hypothetical protein